VQDAQPRSPEREDFPAFGGNPGRRGEPLQEPAGAAQPLTFRSGCDWQSPLRGFGGDRNQRHGQSAAAPVPSLLSPLGGQIGEARRSLCSSALPSRWGAGTAPGSPAVRGGSPAAQRPFERGCTDRSADRCADRHTLVTARVRACGGLDAAEAAPRRCVSWRSRGRWWRGPLARATERLYRLSTVPEARLGVSGKPLGRAPRLPATAVRQRLAAPAKAAPGRCLGTRAATVTEQAPVLATMRG